MHSCLYQGHVWHRRHRPVAHAFRYPLYLAYLDLEEIDALQQQGLWLSSHRYAPLSFRVRDHLPANSRLIRHLAPAVAADKARASDLAEAVRRMVNTEHGFNLCGPVRLLTFLRNWGYYFAPLNVYYCYDASGSRVRAMLAEVSNTPWLERHYYLLDCQANEAGPQQTSGHIAHDKDFHVSPFMPMEVQYRWHWWEPGEALQLRLANTHAEPPFVARLHLRRLPLTNWNLARLWAGQPWLTGTVFASIYWQALRLWMKKCPYYPHPRKQATRPVV